MKLHESIRIASGSPVREYPTVALRRQLRLVAHMLSGEVAPYYVDLVCWCPVGSGSARVYNGRRLELNDEFGLHMLPYRVVELWPMTTNEEDGVLACTRLRMVLADITLEDLLRRT